MTLTCSHGGVKVKMKCTLHIYIVPSVDWYHHLGNRSSSFGGEANTNCYPSAKIICDERMDGRTNGRTDGHTDYYMATLRGHNKSPNSLIHKAVILQIKGGLNHMTNFKKILKWCGITNIPHVLTVDCIKSLSIRISDHLKEWFVTNIFLRTRNEAIGTGKKLRTYFKLKHHYEKYLNIQNDKLRRLCN